MKKMFLTAAAAAMTLSGLALATVQVQAQSANAASVSKDFGCVGFVPTDTGGFGSFLVTGEGTHAVVTKDGLTNFTCHFDIPEGQQPTQATRAEGFGCNTPGGFTFDTRMTASPGGRATLTCKIRL